MLDAKYRPLKDYVARTGGMRLAMHGGLRDQLVEIAVEEFPIDAPRDRVEEVLVARLRRRVRKRYGSVILTILLGVVIQLVVNAVVEWWKKNHTHRVLMEGWNAQSRADMETAVDREED